MDVVSFRVWFWRIRTFSNDKPSDELFWGYVLLLGVTLCRLFELSGHRYEEVGAGCSVCSCVVSPVAFNSNLVNCIWLDCASLFVSRTDCLFDLLCFSLFCHVELNNMKTHTLPPGRAPSSWALCLLSSLLYPNTRTRKHTHTRTQTKTHAAAIRPDSFLMTPDLICSLSLTLFILLYLSQYSGLICRLSVRVPLRLPLFVCPLIPPHRFSLRSHWVDVGEDRCYKCQRARLGDISHCLLFRIKSELGEWSCSSLSWERRSVFQTPTEADRKRDKEREEMSKGEIWGRTRRSASRRVENNGK